MKLKIMTWNVENLFRNGEEGGPADAATYRTKLTAVAQTIRNLNPDVLALQELGSEGAFSDLANELRDLLPHTVRPIVESHVSGLTSVGQNPGERKGKPASDHAAVTVTLEL